MLNAGFVDHIGDEDRAGRARQCARSGHATTIDVAPRVLHKRIGLATRHAGRGTRPPPDARASAAGVLYSSMWLGAAAGGLAAVAAPSARFVVAGAALSWAAAALVAWRGFLASPAAA